MMQSTPLLSTMHWRRSPPRPGVLRTQPRHRPRRPSRRPAPSLPGLLRLLRAQTRRPQHRPCRLNARANQWRTRLVPPVSLPVRWMTVVWRTSLQGGLKQNQRPPMTRAMPPRLRMRGLSLCRRSPRFWTLWGRLEESRARRRLLLTPRALEARLLRARSLELEATRLPSCPQPVRSRYPLQARRPLKDRHRRLGPSKAMAKAQLLAQARPTPLASGVHRCLRARHRSFRRPPWRALPARTSRPWLGMGTSLMKRCRRAGRGRASRASRP